MRPAEHLVTAARRRVLSAPGVVVGSWDVHALRSHSMVRLVPHCQVQTSYLWARHARRVVCVCVLWATSFNLYEWLEYADARDALGDGCSLSSRPVTAPMESLPKREKHTRRREKSRPTAMRSPPNSSNARIRFVLRVGKGVRASISLGNSSCRILMQFCRIAVSVIVIGAKCGSHASQKRTVDAARRRPRDNRLQLKECIPRRRPKSAIVVRFDGRSQVLPPPPRSQW